MKHFDWPLSVVTLLLFIATAFVGVATKKLADGEERHSVADSNRNATESLMKLQSVMDATPNTRECMRYVLSVKTEKYWRDGNDYLHDLMNNNWPVPIISDGPEYAAKLSACLGGYAVQHPEVAAWFKFENDEKVGVVAQPFSVLATAAARTYIRQQISNFLNVLDVASSFALLDERFNRNSNVLETESRADENKFDAGFLIWREVRSVLDIDTRRFILKWHEGSNEPLFSEFPMCKLVARSAGEDCGLPAPSSPTKE